MTARIDRMKENPTELRNIIARIDTLDRQLCICAKRPWVETAEAILVELTADCGIPPHVKESPFEYFLEVPLVLEVLKVFEGQPPTLDEKVRLAIHYAEQDAYPDWVYERNEQ